MNYNIIQEEKLRKKELRRFYNQQKSTRKECDYGRKLCCNCENRNTCKIWSYVGK